jgi:ATP-binding cassette subfamily B protein
LAIFGAFVLVSQDGWSFNPGLTLGTVVAFLSLSKSFTQPIGQVAQQINSIAMALAGASRIFALTDSPAEKDEGYVELCNATEGPDGQPVESEAVTGQVGLEAPAQRRFSHHLCVGQRQNQFL